MKDAIPTRQSRVRWIGAIAVAVAANLGGVARAERPLAPVAPMRLLNLGDVRFGPGPACLPRGAEEAVIEGDPAHGASLTVLRLPEGYRVPWHLARTQRLVTVLGGAVMVATADGGGRVLTAGGLALLDGDRPVRFTCAGGGACLIEVHDIGPRRLTYVDPDDDPRRLMPPARRQ